MIFVRYLYKLAKLKIDKTVELQGWYYEETYCYTTLMVLKFSRAMCIVLIPTLAFNLYLVMLDPQEFWKYKGADDTSNNPGEIFDEKIKDWAKWANWLTFSCQQVCMDWMLFFQLTEWFVMNQLILAQKNLDYREVIYKH